MGAVRKLEALIAAATVAAVACSGRSVQHERDGGHVGGAGEAGTSANDECLIASRYDQCCPAPEAVTRAEYDADPCLMLWPVVGAPEWRAGCPEITCNGTCTPSAPVSRTVARGVGGRCEFVSECAGDEDCAVATDATECCACPEAVPKSLLGSAACLLPAGTPAPASCNACGDVNCEPCVAANPLACLPLADGRKHCVFAPKLELAPDQCAVEQECADNPSYGCTVCLAPSEKACGGPAPLPADCSSDADCEASAAHLICEAAPCELAHCIPGCSADTDCHSGEYCGSDHRCAPKSCGSDEECGATEYCEHQRCAPRPCATSADCGGYCVKGRCFESPGSCADGCVP